MAVLLARHLRYDFTQPGAPGNDQLIFSRGHASPLLYSMLRAVGAIGEGELLSYRKVGSRLEGHPTPRLPWVEVASCSGLGNLKLIVDVNRLGQRGPARHGWDTGAYAARRAATFARHASCALTLALRMASCADLNDQLKSSLASRAVIDQAVCVIMATERCPQDRAFALLRSVSQNTNVKLRDLAADIVTNAGGEPPLPPPHSRMTEA